MDGPLISAFNTTVNRLSEIDRDLVSLEAKRADLVRERLKLLDDLIQAKSVLAHLAPPSGNEAQTPSDPASIDIPRKRKRPIQESSTVGWARRVLRTAKRPMHVDELIKMIEQMAGRQVSKATLVSNLSRYVNQNDTFRRPQPNTYELIDVPNSGDMRLVG